MPIARSRTFRSGNSQAIRLPVTKDVAFGDDLELLIVRSGDVITIYPAAATIPEMITRLRALPVPPQVEPRDEEEIPNGRGSSVAFLLDTNVAIHLRDGGRSVTDRVALLDDAVLMSIVTRVALEGGVHRDPVHAAVRRARLDAILATIPTLAFDDADADAYAGIVARAGYSRRKVLDRMIAAQALVHRATLVTLNPDYFADVGGLELRSW